jgi:inner membrane protein
MTQTLALPRLPRRSMGLKLLLVCGLALVMSIPALFVFALLADRTHRADEVTREISGLVGGPQTFLGPVLAVPYTLPPAAKDQPVQGGVYVVFPASGRATVASKSEVRQRSLFKVPVYKADIGFSATFDLKVAAARAPKDAQLDWNRAEFLLGASDARGALSDVNVSVAGQSRPVAPASVLGALGGAGSEVEAPSVRAGPGAVTNVALKLFGASAAGVPTGAPFQVTAAMRFSGAQRFDVLPFAKTTRLEASGDWASPSFDGGFLPTRRDVSANGFTASWDVPFLARGVPAQGEYGLISALGQASPGVSFVEPANPYQSVARSLKYALMFVGLVFLAYFIFETTQKRRVHPAQYVLIGLAQIVFYLLLLSIAERIGFDLAFLVAAGATVGLISAYAGWVFASRRQGAIALVAFSLLYGLIYVLMRLEDLALLVGALASFAAIAAVMYVTRRLDWYGAPAPDAALASKEAS